MIFIEFLEAFARIAEKISPIPAYSLNKQLDSDERKLQPLHFKIEGLAFVIYTRTK